VRKKEEGAVKEKEIGEGERRKKEWRRNQNGDIMRKKEEGVTEEGVRMMELEENERNEREGRRRGRMNDAIRLVIPVDASIRGESRHGLLNIVDLEQQILVLQTCSLNNGELAASNSVGGIY
jgi:hypothetical protein